jgi:hypothetical protein
MSDKRAENGRIKRDAEQLTALLNHCPDICPNKSRRPLPIGWLPTKFFAFCGCWFAMMDEREGKYLPVCEAETIFQGRKTRSVKFFQDGISRKAFLDLFASCRIGALLKTREAKEEYTERALKDGHAILEVLQRGKWISK